MVPPTPPPIAAAVGGTSVLVFPPGTSLAPPPPAPLGATGLEAPVVAGPVGAGDDAPPPAAGPANIATVGVSESVGPSPALQPMKKASAVASSPHDGPGAMKRCLVVTSGKGKWTLMARAWRETTGDVECVSKDRGRDRVSCRLCST